MVARRAHHLGRDAFHVDGRGRAAARVGPSKNIFCTRYAAAVGPCRAAGQDRRGRHTACPPPRPGASGPVSEPMNSGARRASEASCASVVGGQSGRAPAFYHLFGQSRSAGRPRPPASVVPGVAQVAGHGPIAIRGHSFDGQPAPGLMIAKPAAPVPSAEISSAALRSSSSWALGIEPPATRCPAAEGVPDSDRRRELSWDRPVRCSAICSTRGPRVAETDPPLGAGEPGQQADLVRL